MNILVTGATGFLGKRLCLRMAGMGYNVAGIGRNENVGAVLNKNGIEFVEADLRDKDRIVGLCKDVDYVFHCGALSSLRGRYKDFYTVNVGGTKNIIQGCEKYKVNRLIHVSTPSVYFNYKHRFNIKENEPLPDKMVNHYAKTKLMAEHEIDSAHKRGLPVITIRPRAIFGPGDTSVFPELIRANQSFGIPIIDGGNIQTDIVYVDNVVDSLLLCKDSPANTLGKKYNITNGEPIILKDGLAILFKKMNIPFKEKKMSFSKAYCLARFLEHMSMTLLFWKEPFMTRYSVGIISRSMTLDISAAKNDLGYTPKIGIEEGLDLFVQWWKEQQH